MPKLRSSKNKHRHHPYKAHFEFGRTSKMPDVIMTGESSSKKQKTAQHEARMIPGLTDGRVFGFPNSIITKLRYCTYGALTGTSGARALQIYSCNGIYDPDITGVGHQPLYRDNYSAIYNQYVVLGSKCTVTYLPRTADQCLIGGITMDEDGTVSTNVETLMEQNNSAHRGITPPGGPLETITAYFEPLQHFGVDAKDDGTASTNVGSNPGQQYVYGVWVAAADNETTIVCDIKVEIEYTVKFAELLTPVQN